MNPQADFIPHVTTLGQGSRRALALHCTMAFGGAWLGVAKALGAQLTVIAPDMPSHGRSVDWDEVSDFSDTVFRASMATLDDAPMDVIGHSFGAATALRMMAEHPDRIRSLTLIEPVFFAAAIADTPNAIKDHDHSVSGTLAALLKGDKYGAARAFNQMWSDGAKWDSLSERSREAMARSIHVVPGTQPFLYEDTSGLLEQDRLEAVRVPTLIMRGANTLESIAAVNKELLRRLGNATEVVIANAGHMAPISHPVQVGAAIAALLDRS